MNSLNDSRGVKVITEVIFYKSDDGALFPTFKQAEEYTLCVTWQLS
jgi:hypothetical protein